MIVPISNRTKKGMNRAKQLKMVREYRQYTQSDLSKNIEGLTQSSISKFEKGLGDIKEEKLKEIMIFFNWPFEFLDKVISIEYVVKPYWL